MEHSTFELATKIAKLSSEFSKIFDPARRLDRFYIPTRYPNGLPGGVPYKHFTKQDFENALADGKTIMEQCQKFLKGKGVGI